MSITRCISSGTGAWKKSALSETEELATKDPLTGIYNRRAFDKKIKHCIEEAKETDAHFSLLFVDVDDSKQINDGSGHAVGDEYLKLIAKKVMVGLRQDDFFARYGGDEFCVIFKNCNIELASKISGRLLTYLLNNKLEIMRKQYSVSLSLGLTAYRKGDSTASILKRADEALYLAKEKGKGQLVCN